jgi:hypothetical protein
MAAAWRYRKSNTVIHRDKASLKAIVQATEIINVISVEEILPE